MGGVRSGGNATPTLFVNGGRHDGLRDKQTLIDAFEEAAEPWPRSRRQISRGLGNAREGDKVMIVQHPIAQVVPRTRTLMRTAMVWQIESSPRRPSDSALGQLLRALELLNRRGTGVEAWAAPFRDNPIAFLLDSIGDALRLWSSSGELLFQNCQAARLAEKQGGHELHGAKVRHSREAPLERFTSRGQRFERRSLRCAGDGIEYVIEIVHPLTAGDGA